jgi:hypothetical protein
VLDRQQRALAESVRCGCALDIDLEPLPSDHQRPPPCAAFFLCWDDSAVLSSRAVNYRALERPNPEAVLRNCLEFDAASVWITSTTSRRPAVRMRRSSEGLAQAINTRQQGPARGRFARHQATLSTPRLPWSWPAADRKLDQYVFAIGNPFARLLLVRCARS